MSAEPQPGFFRRRRWLTTLLVLLAILVPASWGVMSYVDRKGWEFFYSGKDILETVGQMADHLEAADTEGLSAFYAEDFQGRSLGLGTLTPQSDRDGLRVASFESAAALPDRDAAVAEWRDYLAGFEEIETAGMWVHRMEDWGKSGHVATVRFELIGRPVGAPRSGIDRAIFRMRFVPQGDGLVIAGTELVEGDRVIADEPHFVDVGPEAGIDFENQYYPDFLTTELEFGMLRYGPAGISAVDIDEDGWYDLFIPDGVESKMFRNQGDGTFADITEAVGLSGQDGVSVAVFADYDNDGDKDAFISRTFTPNRLFRNDGGTYVDVTEEAGIGADCCTTVASWGDIDNDGLLDLYVGRYLDPRLAIPTTFYARNGEPNQLYRNNGDGTFTNVTESSGVGEVGLCLGSVFGDYDDDGDADLYVVNDFGRKTLYRNRGDGTYDDVTVETNTLAYGAGMSASFGDYDNDGLLDIYVAHIRSEEGWYAEAPTVMRYMVNSYRQGVWMEDMPLYWEIFRQSGFSFVDVFQDMASGNTLLRNKGDGTFDDVTWETEANPPGWFWGSGFADFDNDGWQDIYAANGWVYNAPDTEIELEFLNNVVSKQDEYKTGAFFDPDNFGGESWHGYERNRHLINLGDGNFKEVGRAVGTDLLLNSRGIAVADFWNRGVLDIAVAASTDRHALLRNEVGSARDYLAVELVGAAGELDNGSNRDAVGARVIVEAGGQTMTREIALGDGYSSQNSLRLYFGLGSERSADPEAPAPVVEKVTVRWPRSGIVQTFESVAGNRIVEIQENRDDMVEKTYAPPTIEAADDGVAGGEGTEVADVGTGGSGSGATAPSVAGEAP